MSLRHMHLCMSTNAMEHALEQGLLGLEVAKASNIEELMWRKTKNALCQVFCLVCPREGWGRGA